jgi:hypothetical protein
MKLRKPANSRLRGGAGSGSRMEDVVKEMMPFLETEDEDGFMAWYESLPTAAEWTEEQSRASSDFIRQHFREALAERKRAGRRW